MSTFMRYGALALMLVAAIGAAFVFARPPQQPETTRKEVSLQKPRSVIIIDICSLRSDHVSSHGYKRPTTPNLDAFAKESADFENNWTQAGWCLPNFATLLTGTRPEVHQETIASVTQPRKLPATIETLAGILTQEGFATAGFSGSRYLMPGTYGLERGFEAFTNTYAHEDHAMGSMSFGDNLPKVKDWLEANKEKPFFLYVTIDDLHSPYTHADDPKLFDPDYNGVLDTVGPDLFFDRIYNGENITDQPATAEAVARFKQEPNHLEHLTARYDAAVVTTDRLVGELVAELKRQGVWDDSLIIITAHQGEQLGEHGLLGHANGLYEPILNVPLMIHYPGGPEDTRFTELTERIDVPATVLDALGLLEAHKAQFTGSSLVPLLGSTSTPSTWKKYVFASSQPPTIPSPTEHAIDERAVRNERYKLLWYRYKTPEYELYDLEKDPKELTNIAEKNPEVLAELKAKLEEQPEHN